MHRKNYWSGWSAPRLEAGIDDGSVTVNAVSVPDDATEMVPPWARMIDLVMASPRPVPSLARWREGSTRKKRSNTRSKYSWGIVSPVFSMSIETESELVLMRTSTVEPAVEWRTALD